VLEKNTQPKVNNRPLAGTTPRLKSHQKHEQKQQEICGK
jgi:anthranilate/para-aminobenzoate synthase component I